MGCSEDSFVHDGPAWIVPGSKHWWPGSSYAGLQLRYLGNGSLPWKLPSFVCSTLLCPKAQSAHVRYEWIWCSRQLCGLCTSTFTTTVRVVISTTGSSKCIKWLLCDELALQCKLQFPWRAQGRAQIVGAMPQRTHQLKTDSSSGTELNQERLTDRPYTVRLTQRNLHTLFG